MDARLLHLLALGATVQPAPVPDPRIEPYRILIEANRRLDPQVAASAYTSDAILAFNYSGLPPEEHRGRDAIVRSYARTFGSVAPATSVDLAFRLDPGGANPALQSGVYRVTVAIGERTVRAYGRFSVVLRQEDGRWRFAEDHGREATAADFDGHGGSLIGSD